MRTRRAHPTRALRSTLARRPKRDFFLNRKRPRPSPSRLALFRSRLRSCPHRIAAASQHQRPALVLDRPAVPRRPDSSRNRVSFAGSRPRQVRCTRNAASFAPLVVTNSAYTFSSQQLSRGHRRWLSWLGKLNVKGLLPNNPIKLTVQPVTQLAGASCAPVWPATYRARYAH